MEGEEARIECKVKGDDSLEVFWQHGGKTLESGSCSLLRNAFLSFFFFGEALKGAASRQDSDSFKGRGLPRLRARTICRDSRECHTGRSAQ